MDRSSAIPITKENDIIFQALAWHAEDVDFAEYEPDDNPNDKHQYIIKVFGTDKQGQTVSATIKNFTPYFYVKVPDYLQDRWARDETKKFFEFLLTKINSLVSHQLMNVKVIKRKDFWGFTNGHEFKFLRLDFKSLKCMRMIQKALSFDVTIRSISMKPMRFKLYESNIDPYIRFIHINDLEPCGWIKLPAGKYKTNHDALVTNCQLDVEIDWRSVEKYDLEETAPFVVCSFDLECTSNTGDFPVPLKNYKKLAADLYDLYTAQKAQLVDYDLREAIRNGIMYAFGANDDYQYKDAINRVEPKQSFDINAIEKVSKTFIDDICTILSGKISVTSKEKINREKIVAVLTTLFGEYRQEMGWISKMGLPQLKGDPIIQIGSTFHKYGERDCFFKHIITLGTCTDVQGAVVETCNTEEELLLKWRNLILKTNPDVITGYNIFGFDFWYLFERAKDLRIAREFMTLGRFHRRQSNYKENRLSSSALGDNILKFIDMEGRVLIDLMKVVQRDHKLDSYKLDNVAHHFMGMNKNDVSPQDIFRLQKGTADDRQVIASYCIQDCSLCNHLMIKLEIIANNMGMSNVCLVPLSFIFMRGQGIKIFSLVLKQCKEDGFLIPVIKATYGDAAPAEEESYEGAIVLEPQTGIYLDTPISVLDYASLYPSSMISENLSQDSIVLDPKYDNLPGVDYLDIEWTQGKVARFVQPKNGEKGVIPRILMTLLKARKTTRKRATWQSVILKDGTEYRGFYDDNTHKITLGTDGTTIQLNLDSIADVRDTYGDFQKAVLDGLQLAYKVTANSLYGQMGAKTSPVYMKEIAASTTATGRKMILMAKDFIEKNYEGAHIVYGDSVASYTPITCQEVATNNIVIDTVENIGKIYGGNKWVPCIEEGKQDKEGCEVSGLNVWTENGWTHICNLIRHKLASHKKMIRVLTHNGIVDVTDDHSLLKPDGTKISPNDLSIGDRILHSQRTYHPDIENVSNISCNEAQIMGMFMGDGSCDKYASGENWAINHIDYNLLLQYKGLCEEVYPYLEWTILDTVASPVYKLVPKSRNYGAIAHFVNTYRHVLYNNNSKIVPTSVLNSSKNVRQAFLNGFFDADGDKDSDGFVCFKSQLSCARLHDLARSLGYNVSIDHKSDNLNIFRLKMQCKETSVTIKEMREIPYEGHVYDITTENHHFQAGIGSIIVHNTDSLFVKFKTKDELGNSLTGVDAIRKSRNLGIDVSCNFKQIIKPPHDLEWEKLFYPFILLSKKRYVGNKYEMDDHKFKQASMGIVLKRRDNANIVKKIYGGVIDIILNQKNVGKAVEFLNTQLNDLVEGRCPLEDLIITKSLRAEYKDPSKIAHKVLAERIGERDPGNKPQINDRIPFVYVEQEAEAGKKILQGERIETPDYIKANNIKPDYNFYITNQIMKPLLQLFAIVVEQLPNYSKPHSYFEKVYEKLLEEYEGNEEKVRDKLDTLKEKEVQKLLFDPVIQGNMPQDAKPKRARKNPYDPYTLMGLPPPPPPDTIPSGTGTDSEAKPKATRRRKVAEKILQDAGPPPLLPTDMPPTDELVKLHMNQQEQAAPKAKRVVNRKPKQEPEPHQAEAAESKPKRIINRKPKATPPPKET